MYMFLVTKGLIRIKAEKNELKNYQLTWLREERHSSIRNICNYRWLLGRYVGLASCRSAPHHCRIERSLSRGD